MHNVLFPWFERFGKINIPESAVHGKVFCIFPYRFQTLLSAHCLEKSSASINTPPLIQSILKIKLNPFELNFKNNKSFFTLFNIENSREKKNFELLRNSNYRGSKYRELTV